MTLSVQQLICWLILAVASLISPAFPTIPKPVLTAVSQCNAILALSTTPTPAPFEPNRQCEGSPDGISPDFGVAEITQKPLLKTPKNEPVLEYNFSTLYTPYSYGTELQRYIMYVQEKPNGIKQVHQLLTTPSSLFKSNSSIEYEIFPNGKLQQITLTPKDDVVMWSGQGRSVKLVNTLNWGFDHLLVSSQQNAIEHPEQIVYLVPHHPELTQTFQVVTQAQFIDSLPREPVASDAQTQKKNACYGFHRTAIPFADPWNIVTPTNALRYALGSRDYAAAPKMAIPINTCPLEQSGWPVAYNTTATTFNPDGINTLEHISLQSHPYDCYCNGKNKQTCFTYTLTVRNKTYVLGNNFRFYKPLSGFMALLNGNLVLLHDGSLYEVSGD